MSIVKKNLKATKGKKRWRKNIDITELIDEVETLKKQEKLDKEVNKGVEEQKLKEKKDLIIEYEN